ncbi:MAG: hypothetical protein EXR02_00530 [Rhodospirillales bacterium]|nr:hypothetical protein [Rhodospirillales bacterium]MSP79543.1 hypothetical protein [Rhodospirillales bacterium]
MSRAFPVFALVPVRAFPEGKKRLAPLMSPEERAMLAKTMLEDVLDCLGRSPAVEGIAVVTDDADAAALALDHGARVLPDAPEPNGGLNASLAGAAAWLRATHPGRGASFDARGVKPARPGRATLIIHADLPAATPEDIAALVAEDAEIVLARAHDGGTNAMLLRPGVSLPFAFGPESCARHQAAARAAGLSVAVVERPGLSLDLDRPEDVAAYLARAGNSRTLGLLHRQGIPARRRALNDAPLPARARTDS